MADLGMVPTQREVKPGERLLVLVRSFAQVPLVNWILVVDNLSNVGIGSREALERARDAALEGGRIIITTRRLDVARKFVGHTGLCIPVTPLDASSAASILACAPSPLRLGIYDYLAGTLGYAPRTLVSASKFLLRSGMDPHAYNADMAYLVDEKSWREDGLAVQASTIAFGLPSSWVTGHCHATVLAAVLRSCIDPNMFFVFDQLGSQHPVADELLSTLSMLGKTTLAAPAMSSALSGQAATRLLVDNSILRFSPTAVLGASYEMSDMLMVARRAWLVRRKRLVSACAAALQLVRFHYPDGPPKSVLG